MLASYKQIGQNQLHFDEIDSTNVFALDLLSKTNPIEGTVISADFQTLGKGQFGRKWESSKGENIIMSIILYPNFLTASQQFELSQCISLAVHDYLSTFINDVSIKWPNDIYYLDKKISGILIQNVLTGSNIKSSIIGIGLNVNQSIFNTEITNPTSLSLITKNKYDVSSQRNLLLKKIEERYNQLAIQGYSDKMKKEYLEHLYFYDKIVTIELEEGMKTDGKIIDVNKSGMLIVMNVKNEKIALTHGQVNVIYKDK